MKFQKALFLFAILLFSVNSADAQFFKRIKDKAKQKLEREAEKAVDKSIDSISFKKNKNKNKKNKKNKKEKSQKQITSNATSGSAIINHQKMYGGFNIQEFGKAKLERTDNGVKIYGSWVSHAADIHDGYVLDIKDGNNLLFDGDQPTQKQITLSIPEEASLKLSYDPVWDPNQEDEYGRSSAVTKDYQSYNLESGKVTIDVVSQDNIQFSFSGTTKLEIRVKNDSNSEDTYSSTFTISDIMGSLDVGPILFLDNRLEEESDDNQDAETVTLPTLNQNTATPGIYNFTFETVVKLTNLEDNETYKMSYLLNPETEYIGIMADMAEYSDAEMEGESLIVMDGEDIHIFVETQGMKMRMSQGMMGGQKMQNPTQEMANYDYTNLKKTGKTKTVLGAKCFEYIMSDKDVKIEMWVAPSVNLPNWFVQNSAVLDGHIMEYTITSKDGNMKSETIAIKDHISKTINPKDYKKMF